MSVGKLVEVRVLHVVPYESSRKRMSVIVQLPDGSVYLYCKGADSVMLELHDSDANSAPFVEKLTCQVAAWAEEAFRTMVFGYKPLDAALFASWLEEYEAASNDPAEKAKKQEKQPNRIDALEFQLENGLVLQGATAIEDSLQTGVPETLAQLIEAGIHVWMITGDKVGTAKNIAVACNLLKLSEMKLLEFTKEAVDASLIRKNGRVTDLTEKLSS